MYMKDCYDISWLQYSAIIVIVYCISLAMYRITFDPLAKYPGPKIAAITGYYEFYHDYICNGMYTFEIAKMHKRYGR